LIVLVVLLATPAIWKRWERTTLAWHSEAHALAEQGRYEDAIGLLNRAMRLSPDPEVRHGSYAVRASFHAKAGSLDQAIDDMNRAVAWSQEQGDQLLVPHVVTRGIYKLNAQRLEDAISDFDLALQLVDREDEVWRQRFSHFAAIAHYYRGVAHRNAGREAEAEDDLRAAEELDPEWVATVSRLPEGGTP
jgi:tetratricopeptide (TPR) repeat protein